MNVAVVGSGSWGTALTILLARNGHRVTLLGRNEEEIRTLRETGENARYLPGYPVPEGVRFEMLGCDLEVVDMTVLAVPSGAVREVTALIRGHHPLVVLAAKGLEAETGKLMTEVAAEALPGAAIGALSGPNLAVEIAKGIPTLAVAAYAERAAAETVRDAFSGPAFRVSVSDDVIGVELAGALKNVLAIGGGMSDGLGYGDNTKGAFLSRGLMEMARLGTAMGGRIDSFLGPAGVGDLFATAASRLSRNYRVGFALGEGKSLQEAVAALGQVAEGVPTSEATVMLARRYAVDLPVFAAIQGVLKGLISPQEAAGKLMQRIAPMDDFLGA
ncbi:NAD(P)-dependent glycerol-3-phosphate dehydrogenase [bacterium]|nr:MAG: NAD(P)-dependent glycerol-3-phosphate dehydrogenase [bacterium]